MKIKWKTLIGNLIIPLVVGALSGFLTRNAMDSYQQLRQPPLAPPSILFPIIWTTLFVLMGISAYLVSVSTDGGRYTLPKLYWVQLVVNFIWPFIFFNFGMYLVAFFWLILLIALVAAMIVKFYRISHTAAYLQLPYLLWLIFAGYLNLGILLLN